MRSYLLALLLFFVPLAARADSSEAEMRNYQKSLNDAFKDFPDKPQPGQMDTRNNSRGGGGKNGSNAFSTSNLNKASQSAYTKSQVMKTISQLALAWAQSAGSMQGLQSSQQASQLAGNLSASNDPQFQQMGQLLKQESTAISQANRPGAENYANQIQSVPPPYVPPGYQPTQGESWLVQAFNGAAATVISSLTGVLGVMVVKDILSGLGIDPSSWSLGLGNSLGSNLGRSAVNGQNAAPVLQSGAQSSIGQGTGSLSSSIQQSSGSIVNTNPVQSNQTGTAPSAGK